WEVMVGLVVAAKDRQAVGEFEAGRDGSPVEVHGPPGTLDTLLDPADRTQIVPEPEVPNRHLWADGHRRLVVADRLGRLASLVEFLGEFEVGPDVAGLRLLSPAGRWGRF